VAQDENSYKRRDIAVLPLQPPQPEPEDQRVGVVPVVLGEPGVWGKKGALPWSRRTLLVLAGVLQWP
jgi:hypothetical protein